MKMIHNIKQNRIPDGVKFNKFVLELSTDDVMILTLISTELFTNSYSVVSLNMSDRIF